MVKRLFDITVSFLGLLATSPLLLAAALAVKLSSPGPVFFRQERVGKGGKPFHILKFRTMRSSGGGPLITVGRDPRITRVGHLLRQSKIDELPQLINVLKGNMSFVGPRPEVPRYVALYTDEQRRVLAVRPGITDPASIKYRHEAELLAAAEDPERVYVEKIMPDKLRLNLEYLERAGLLSDLRIILSTLITIFK